MKKSTKSSVYTKRDKTIDFELVSEFLKHEINTLIKLHNDYIRQFEKLEKPDTIQDIYVFAFTKKQLCGKISLLTKTYKSCGLDVDPDDSKDSVDALFAIPKFIDFYKSQLAATQARTEINEIVIKEANANYTTQLLIKGFKQPQLDFQQPSSSPLEAILEDEDETATKQESPTRNSKEFDLSSVALLNAEAKVFIPTEQTTTAEDNKTPNSPPLPSQESKAWYQFFAVLGKDLYTTPIEEIEQKFNIKTDRTDSRFFPS